MNATFPVSWRQVFRSLAIYMSCAIIGGILIPIGIAAISGHAPKRAVPFASMVAYVLVIAPLFSIVFAFLISQWFRLAAVTLGDGVIQGRSYWGRRNRIPLSDITKLRRFNSNGIRSIVFHSKYHGRIYISDKTERLPELLAILAPYVSERPNHAMERRADRGTLHF